MITAGVDLGGSFVKSVVVDGADTVTEAPLVAVPDESITDVVERVARRLIDGSGARGVGVGVAGLVEWPEGRFVWGPHVSGTGIPLARGLRERLGVPVVVDNDANLAAYCEATLGAARGRRNVLMLTFGTGIGAGIVTDGIIHHGRSFAGEVGHMTMVPDGRICACGRRGCWETVVSGAMLDRLAVDLATEVPDGHVGRLAADGTATAEHLTRAADAGDPASRTVLAEAGTWLGRGVVNLILTLDPDIVVIGGAVSQAGRWLLDPARMAIASQLPGSAHRRPPPLVVAEYGPLSGAIGAALAARRVTP
ncbi:MAG: ROK family protein [Acidimicrobiia bacterium]|nr:ROK family protein [Acidimicrobiia bacterium]MDH4306202.1 ROK family protein [Acidimicrobiia bacterium]